MRVMTVVGARPQLVKVATVSRALARGGQEEVLVHTGQHHDHLMSGAFFDDLGIPAPQYELGISGGSHGEMTGRMLVALEQVMVAERPDAVVVFGDTNSTLAGALAAAKLEIPLAHVEAGLRSWNRSMPEETNRVVADHVSDLHLCPTRSAVDNLRREGITSTAHHVGDVMFDAAMHALASDLDHDVLDRLGLVAHDYVVATVHRAENTDHAEALERVFAHLRRVAETTTVLLPLHPRTRAALARFGVEAGRIRVVDPLGYVAMLRLVAGAIEVHTDSGGLQKEAYFLRVPCVTLRHETEWVETVQCGWNRLWTATDWSPRREIDDYGDGHAAERVVDLVAALTP